MKLRVLIQEIKAIFLEKARLKNLELFLEVSENVPQIIKFDKIPKPPKTKALTIA